MRRAPAFAAPATSRTARAASRAAWPAFEGARAGRRSFSSLVFAFAASRVFAFAASRVFAASRPFARTLSTTFSVARAARPVASFIFVAALSAAPETLRSAACSAWISSVFVLSLECPRPRAFRARSRRAWTVMFLNSAMAHHLEAAASRSVKK